MTTKEILDYVNYICVKENSGSTLKPDQYNTILLASNINMFNRLVGEAQLLSLQSKMPFSEALFSMAALKEFHKMQSITFTTGNFNITTLDFDYAYWGSLVTLYGGAYRRIELLTDKDLADRRSNMLDRQLKDYPGAIILGNTIKVYPSNITTADFIYMSIPNNPVFDYYIDANLNIVYLTAGATHLLAAGETGSTGQIAGQTVGSLTVELEYNQAFHIDFCNEVLQKVGVNLQNVQIQQYVREVEGKQS